MAKNQGFTRKEAINIALSYLYRVRSHAFPDQNSTVSLLLIVEVEL